MKKSMIALALALALTGTLAACGGTDNGSSGQPDGGQASTGQVTRRQAAPGSAWEDYRSDGRYTAGADGRVRDTKPERDLTQDARDMLRDGKRTLSQAGRELTQAARDAGDGLKDAAQDIGRGVKQAARDAKA